MIYEIWYILLYMAQAIIDQHMFLFFFKTLETYTLLGAVLQSGVLATHCAPCVQNLIRFNEYSLSQYCPDWIARLWLKGVDCKQWYHGKCWAIHLTMQLDIASFEATIAIFKQHHITFMAYSQRAEPALGADFDGISCISIGVKPKFRRYNSLSMVAGRSAAHKPHHKVKGIRLLELTQMMAGHFHQQWFTAQLVSIVELPCIPLWHPVFSFQTKTIQQKMVDFQLPPEVQHPMHFRCHPAYSPCISEKL